MTRPYMRGPIHQAKEAAQRARAQNWFRQYMGGKTLQEIGDENKVTREYVRQLITKFHGKVAHLGGRSFTAKWRRQEFLARKDAYSLKQHGCTFAQYLELRRFSRALMKRGVSPYQTPIRAYIQQRNNALARGIEWTFTLWSWWQLWQQSGKWGERGRRLNNYVMCRFNDTGPYSPDNVYFDTTSHNIIASCAKRFRGSHPMPSPPDSPSQVSAA